jgi:hypothetical protein
MPYHLDVRGDEVTTTVQTETRPVRESAPRPRGGVVLPVFAEDRARDSQGNPTADSWEQTYVGAVLMKYERNGYDDSDFVAVVYDEATDSLKHIEYASTRGWTYMNGATVDATEEVQAKAREVVRRETFRDVTFAAAAAAKTPEVGKTVRVVKGRKVPVGTQGTVVWKGESAYGKSRYGTWGKTTYRVGVKDAEGTVHFTAADNVTVVDPQEYMPAWSDMEARAVRHAAGNNWRRY